MAEKFNFLPAGCHNDLPGLFIAGYG